MKTIALLGVVLLSLCGMSSAQYQRRYLFGSYGGSWKRNTDCDCQPTWKCPYAQSVQPVRTCQYHGFLNGYCCPRGGGGGGGGGGPIRECTPLVLCPGLLANPSGFGGATCQLADGSTGIVCKGSSVNPMSTSLGNRFGAGSSATPLSSSRVVAQSFMAVSRDGQMSTAANQAAQSVTELETLNNRLLSSGSTPARNSITSLFNLNFRSSQAVQDLGLQALRNLQTITNLNSQGASDERNVMLINRFGNGQVSQGGASFAPAGGNQGFASDIDTTQPTRLEGCENEDPIFCTQSIYRTINGECNNLLAPRRGRGLTGFKRLLPNTYDDSIFAIRSQSVRGGQLPSARLISERVVESISRELDGFTLSVMQWGQFIDHDFNHALVFRLGEEAIECCENDGRTFPSSLLHPQCIPIPIPQNDPFYNQFGQRCMSLTRSIPAPEPDCIARPATPINELTAYLDASMLYGSEDSRVNSLRTFQNGRMIVTADNMLPFRDTPAAQRPAPGKVLFPGRVAGSDDEVEAGDPCRENARVCFRGGEARVNEQSGLTVMHTLFTREHNRLADALQANHPNWNDEQVFQEARRIIIAEWQHIIYNEWLPIVVGYDFARDHNLLPLRSGFSNLYDTTVDASASNEFATAAFRFGHSLLRDMYDLINAAGRTVGSVNVTRTFFDPTIVAERFVEHSRTLIATRGQTFDSNVIKSVHEQLFTTNFRFGLDLISLNIQRGRDHGIPTYVDMLKACTDTTINNWGDLFRLMNPSNIDQLRSVYADVRDVDLFIGGLAERRASGAQVGPTFQCLIGQQFFDVRFGDRYFYDNGGFDHSFTPAQLAEIRKSSWARMLCDTVGGSFRGDFSRMQPLGFIENGVGPNFEAGCDQLAIPTMDLSVF